MQNPGFIATGRGGDGLEGGIGGRGGDVHIHYGNDNSRSPDVFLLTTLPRALYAAHNASREDAPTHCLEGTRVAVLKDILSWSGSTNGERPPVYWLSGLAGIGKSTIAKTVAERAEEERMLGASFFFSRNDKPLRDPGLVLPTLAFQLAHSDSTYNEAFKEIIVEALRRDPTVGRKDLLSQLKELILNPLRNIDPPRLPVLIVLDALDECEEEGGSKILRLVFEHLTRIPFLRILVTCRPQPHLSSVFNKASNLAKTVLHDIEASVIQQDIRFYISTELAKIPEKLDLGIPADWVTEAAMNSLVEKAGKLFVYAATAIRFIGDNRVRDPHRHLSLILDTQSLQKAGATPYLQLDELYMGVLRNSLSPYNKRAVLERFQIVVGSIVVLREPLPLRSLAEFVQREPQVVEASLSHLHSVIVPPSDIHEAPRIYHASFLEFITDPSRCSMAEFLIVPVPEQELRHAIRCFELMARDLKRDIAGISNPSLLNVEVDGFEKKVREALSPEVQYACRYWASHLSRVEGGEGRMMEALERFAKRSILWWFEAMSLLGSISNAVRSIQEAHRWAQNSRCESIIIGLLSDSYRFILAHGEVIRQSALHVYHSAMSFTPYHTALYKAYCDEGKHSIQLVQGMESEWSQTLVTFVGHYQPVSTIAFSPDGLLLASGSTDDTVWLWDATSGMSIAKLEGHSGSITIVVFSPDGSCLASGSVDNTVRLWDAISGAPIAKLSGHSNWVGTIAFSPDGLCLASGSGSPDHTIQLWDAISGASIAKLDGHSDGVLEVAFSPIGFCLASASSDHTLQLWDATSGVSIAKLKGHHDLVWTVAFSPDGLRLASGSRDCTVQLWDGISGVFIAKLEGHSAAVTAVAFSPDGLHLASGSEDSTVQLWDGISGAFITKLKGHSARVTTIAFSPNGLHLASGSRDMTVQLWDGISGRPITKLKGHSGEVGTIAFSPNGWSLASSSGDGTIRLWDPISTASISNLEDNSAQVMSIAISLDGLHLATGFSDGALQLWDVKSGASMIKWNGHYHWVTPVAFSPNGLCLASASWNNLHLWDGISGASIANLEGHSNFITSITFSPNGLCLASGSWDDTVQLWDGISGRPIAKLEGHSDSVMVLAFSPDGLHLASGSEDRTVQLWDVVSGASIAKLEGHHGCVRAVAFSPDALHLASGSDDCTVQLWDAVSGISIIKLEGHSNWVLEVSFPFGGGTLISRSQHEVIPWDLTSHPPCRIPSGSHLATSSSLTPPIWFLYNRWLGAVRQDGQAQRICYIPPHYTPSTRLMVSSHQTHPRVAVGCKQGHVIILAVPQDPFDSDLPFDQPSLLTHHVKPRRKRAWGFRKVLRELKAIFSH